MANRDITSRRDTVLTAADVVPVTPNDSTDLPGGPCRALRVTGAGDLVFISVNGNTRTVPVVANEVVPWGAQRVLATGTTATGIFALY